jgi:hypothetical protein
VALAASCCIYVFHPYGALGLATLYISFTSGTSYGYQGEKAWRKRKRDFLYREIPTIRNSSAGGWKLWCTINAY